MALKKFLFGFNSYEFKKLQILFVNGEKARLIQQESLDKTYDSMEKFFFIRLTSVIACGAGAYLLPVPLDLIFRVPIKLLIFSFSHRTLTFMSKMEYLNALQACCEENKLDEKIEMMDLAKNDKSFLNSYFTDKKKNEKEEES